MTFAALVIERPPLDWSGFWGALGQWLQDAGLYAFIWLLLLGLAYLIVPEFRQRSVWGLLHNTMTVLGGLAVLFFVVFLVLLLAQGKVQDLNAPRSTDALLVNAGPPWVYRSSQKLCLSLAGLAAMTACALPILRDLFQRRIILRRIWAIGRVSIKEAWSRGIVWICLIIPIIYLYADWYISPKPEDQLRQRVSVAYYSMTMLFVFSALLLGAFGISADLKNQNIYTIVTKPVERYEIVLGRLLGYGVLLFAELIVLTGISYVYVDRFYRFDHALSPHAMDESYHARVPLFGNELYYFNTHPVLPGKHKEGESVGYEWNYRGYITGVDPQSRNTRVKFAVWTFDAVPTALVERADDDLVRLEFTFDVFRTSTGQENKGVLCTFTFARGDLAPEEVENLLRPTGLLSSEFNNLFLAAVERNKKVAPGGQQLNVLNAASMKEIHWLLFEKYGLFQIKGISVTDNHTQAEEISPKIFRTLQKHAQSRSPVAGEDKSLPAMQIYINVENDRSSRVQRVGMATADLYLLVADRPFWINFFKGALCIYLIAFVVLTLAVVSSTYLSGIVSLLLTALLCAGGLFLPYIKSIAEGNTYDGGPGESFYRLLHRQTTATPLDRQSITIDLLLKSDSIYRWWLRFLMNVIPDLAQYYPKDYVANGFDITWGPLLFLNYILPVMGYTLPWIMLAYYLMKSREIANT